MEINETRLFNHHGRRRENTGGDDGVVASCKFPKTRHARFTAARKLQLSTKLKAYRLFHTSKLYPSRNLRAWLQAYVYTSTCSSGFGSGWKFQLDISRTNDGNFSVVARWKDESEWTRKGWLETSQPLFLVVRLGWFGSFRLISLVDWRGKLQRDRAKGNWKAFGDPSAVGLEAKQLTRNVISEWSCRSFWRFRYWENRLDKSLQTLYGKILCFNVLNFIFIKL